MVVLNNINIQKCHVIMQLASILKLKKTLTHVGFFNYSSIHDLL